MKSIQIYHLHLANGEIVQAAEDYKLKGKNTIVNLFQRANDEDIFFITDLLLGSCYIPKKKIVYISTGEVLLKMSLNNPHNLTKPVFMRVSKKFA